MVGAVAGTPGTVPTNWTGNLIASSGLQQSIVNVGTSNGINYIDVRVFGTAATGTAAVYSFDAQATTVAATTGQSWTSSVYVSLVAGNFNNVDNLSLTLRENDASTNFLRQTLVSISTVTSTLTRFTNTVTTGASTAFVNSGIRINFISGAVIDFTLRIGLPQLELGAFATSVIPTTNAAATRNADVASMTGTNFSSWYRADEGTMYGEVSSAAITVAGTSRRIANMNDGTESNRITIGWAGAGGVAAAFVTVSGAAQAAFSSPSGAYAFPTKVILAYKVNDFDASVNGTAFADDTSGTVPVVDRMTIGDVVTGGSGPQNINGTIRKIAFWPVRLENAQLQALTR
jgi:hypothetical protein